jgi:pyrroloquinoline quinone (PQQ) biosynthesis protein C
VCCSLFSVGCGGCEKSWKLIASEIQSLRKILTRVPWPEHGATHLHRTIMSPALLAPDYECMPRHATATRQRVLAFLHPHLTHDRRSASHASKNTCPACRMSRVVAAELIRRSHYIFFFYILACFLVPGNQCSKALIFGVFIMTLLSSELPVLQVTEYWRLCKCY